MHHLNSPSLEAKSVRFTLSPWGLEKEEAEGASVVVNFWPYSKIKRCVPPHQKLPKTNMVCQAKLLPRNIAQPFPRTFLLLKSQPPRGHSFSREIHCPEDAPPFESVATPRSILSVPSKMTASTDKLISSYIHGVRYTARSSYVSNIPMTPTPTRTITESSRNCFHHQGQNPNRYRRITMSRSCRYWSMTRTANESSRGIYMLGEDRKEERKRKKFTIRLPIKYKEETFSNYYFNVFRY